MMEEHSFIVPGRIVQSIDPVTSNIALSMPFYLLQSSVLVALAASLLQSLTVTDLKNVPKIAQLNEYPYREASGWLKRILKIDLVQNAHLCFYILFYRRCMFYLRE